MSLQIAVQPERVNDAVGGWDVRGTRLTTVWRVAGTTHEQRRSAPQGQNVDDALSKVLDPIAALDRTSDVVLIGAILAAVLYQSPTRGIAALVRCFIALQNVDSALYAEFQALFNQSPIPFVDAVEKAALTESVTSTLS
ncbi:hypothetical protein [Bradyrhizobium sp. F1.13.3]|uniref:hypothetical protein n=1 Tax=Bradyrhizobium sp. F1.13.3 TaxID=3156351 RepID=UPI003396D486